MINQAFGHMRALFEAHPGLGRRRKNSAVIQPEVLEQRQLLSATGLQAFHRSGQTFITWTEDGAVTGEKYHVYRSSAAVTSANISSAEKLTSHWGALDDNTSVHTRVAPGTGVPANFVINNLAAPLANNQGLFVYTTQENQSGTWYYAVTQVNSGIESLTLTTGANSLSTGISETVAVPQPVLTVSNASGKGRIYTQYMDYAKWNPTFQGYAYNYSVALPDNYDPGVAWPLKLMPHAYGERFRMEPSTEYGWPCVEVFLDDSGGGGAGLHYQTWWYGFAADHNYLTGGSIPANGRVENFTEQRVLKAIDEVSSTFNVDPQRIHSQGHSMGASGSLSLGMRYANVFSGIFSSEPMTNYASSPGFQDDFSVLWGTQASNLPIVSNGIHATPIKKYDGLGVYNWMNHHEQLVNRRGDPMAFLMVGHGKADDVIDWATQGKPFIAALNAGNVGFSAEQRFGWDHNWMSFNFALDTMFSPADGGLSAWAYPKNVSFPGITNATGSGPSVPGTTETNFYNMQFEWSVPWNQFHTSLVDTSSRYEISLRASTVTQTANVTPQRVQAFKPAPGATVTWQNINNANGQVVQSGTLVVDVDGLVTVPAMTIGTGVGHRLVLTTQSTPAPAGKPILTGPASTTTSQTPLISWSGTDETNGYDLLVKNLSTGQNPAIRLIVDGLNYIPASNLGIGRYSAQVRSRFTSGQYSEWSALKYFQINTPPIVDPVPSVTYTGKPLFLWNNIPGAAKYELKLKNKTTGLDSVVIQNRTEQNSFQAPNSLGLATYQVFVRGLDASNLPGLWSTAKNFTSAAEVILIGPDGSSFNTLPTLTWSAIPGASRYEMVLKDVATNANIASELHLTSTSWTPASALPKGDYRWWVRAHSDAGIVGSWSMYKNFNIGGKPRFISVSGTTNDRTPTLLWNAVQGAAKYELWIVRVDTNTVVQSIKNLTSNTYTPSTDLTPQTYRFWVRAFSASGVVSDWGNSVTITVTSLDPSVSPAPELDEPLTTALEEIFLVSGPANKCRPMADNETFDDIDQIAAADELPEVASLPETDIDQLMIEWAING